MTATAIAVNMHGNRLPQVPNAQVGIGAQYTAHLNDGYTLVPRVDYYWQSQHGSARRRTIRASTASALGTR